MNKKHRDFFGRDGTSADSLAPDEFRQRIETKPALDSHETTATSEDPKKSVPSTLNEPAAVSPDNAELWNSDLSIASDATAAEEREPAPTESVETGLTQGGNNGGSNNYDGLCAAYLTALRASISEVAKPFCEIR